MSDEGSQLHTFVKAELAYLKAAEVLDDLTHGRVSVLDQGSDNMKDLRAELFSLIAGQKLTPHIRDEEDIEERYDIVKAAMLSPEYRLKEAMK